MKLQKVVLSTLMMAISLPTFAGSLYILNNTKFPSTVIANNGPCSASALGEMGITRPGKDNTIPEDKLKSACLKSKTNCVAEVFMTDHCSDNPKTKSDVIAIVTIDIYKGIKSVTLKSNKFIVKASDFSAEISEAPNSTRWLKWIFGKKN